MTQNYYKIGGNKMKEESKKTKNKNINTIKILTIVLLIILISMIGFFGIYAQEKNQMKNSVKDYSYAMDINGARTLKLQVNKETSEVIKDKDGNVIKVSNMMKKYKKMVIQKSKLQIIVMMC